MDLSGDNCVKVIADDADYVITQNPFLEDLTIYVTNKLSNTFPKIVKKVENEKKECVACFTRGSFKPANKTHTLASCDPQTVGHFANQLNSPLEVTLKLSKNWGQFLSIFKLFSENNKVKILRNISLIVNHFKKLENKIDSYLALIETVQPENRLGLVCGPQNIAFFKEKSVAVEELIPKISIFTNEMERLKYIYACIHKITVGTSINNIPSFLKKIRPAHYTHDLIHYDFYFDQPLYKQILLKFDSVALLNFLQKANEEQYLSVVRCVDEKALLLKIFPNTPFKDVIPQLGSDLMRVYLCFPKSTIHYIVSLDEPIQNILHLLELMNDPERQRVFFYNTLTSYPELYTRYNGYLLFLAIDNLCLKDIADLNAQELSITKSLESIIANAESLMLIQYLIFRKSLYPKEYAPFLRDGNLKDEYASLILSKLIEKYGAHNIIKEISNNFNEFVLTQSQPEGIYRFFYPDGLKRILSILGALKKSLVLHFVYHDNEEENKNLSKEFFKFYHALSIYPHIRTEVQEWPKVIFNTMTKFLMAHIEQVPPENENEKWNDVFWNVFDLPFLGSLEPDIQLTLLQHVANYLILKSAESEQIFAQYSYAILLYFRLQEGKILLVPDLENLTRLNNIVAALSKLTTDDNKLKLLFLEYFSKFPNSQTLTIAVSTWPHKFVADIGNALSEHLIFNPNDVSKSKKCSDFIKLCRTFPSSMEMTKLLSKFITKNHPYLVDELQKNKAHIIPELKTPLIKNMLYSLYLMPADTPAVVIEKEIFNNGLPPLTKGMDMETAKLYAMLLQQKNKVSLGFEDYKVTLKGNLFCLKNSGSSYTIDEANLLKIWHQIPTYLNFIADQDQKLIFLKTLLEFYIKTRTLQPEFRSNSPLPFRSLRKVFEHTKDEKLQAAKSLLQALNAGEKPVPSTALTKGALGKFYKAYTSINNSPTESWSFLRKK